MKEPSPNWPELLSPQHFAVPFEMSAHVWVDVDVSSEAPESPCTGEGLNLLVVLPSPNWPELLSPQHLAVPRASTRKNVGHLP